MSTLVNFSARGTKFQIPRQILENKPESLLYVLSNDIDIPIDKIDECIYVDVNPIHIKSIIDYYVMDILPNIKKDIFLYMDLKYLSLIDDFKKDVPEITLNMKFPIIYDTIRNHSIVQKWCRIHTIDNNIIIVDLSTFNQNGWNKLSSIIFGFDEKYLIHESEEYLDVWIGIEKEFVNIILSIVRDGLNWYYEFLDTDEEYIYQQLIDKYTNVYDENYINKETYDNNENMDRYRCGQSDCDGYYDDRYDYYCNNCRENYENNKKENENIFYETLDDDGSNKQTVLNNSVVNSINNISNITNLIYNQTEKWLNSIEEDVKSLDRFTRNKYNLEYNQNIKTYLTYYDILTTKINVQLQERMYRYNGWNNNMCNIVSNNNNFYAFTGQELEKGECVIEKNTDRMKNLYEICKYCVKFKEILQKCVTSNKSLDYRYTTEFKNLNVQLNNDLFSCFRNYINGL